jgi:hypothetical protein
MKVDQVKEYLRSIESGSQSYADLLQYDCLFEIKGRWPDDSDLIEIFYDLDHSKFITWQKLRGDRDALPKLADNVNDSKYCHGFIVFTNRENTQTVEKELIVSALKNNISIKKIDVSLIETDNIQKREEHFNSLFDIV